MNAVAAEFVMARLTYVEAGLLLGLLEREEAWRKESCFHSLYLQLVSIKKQVENSVGVKKERLPDGRLYITDNDGNVIIREPYHWEMTE